MDAPGDPARQAARAAGPGAENGPERQTRLARMLELRKGPEIIGHRNSACSLLEVEKRAGDKDTADEDERPGGMRCFV
ncbi:hypothetical protein QMZ92_23245 [Streptomyces sp. HNM0645]|uniref:hypothetical protein n=1 Tax=Streptomyces sp. HNM0645 TaxID=2782343 RepID=UPI0024B74D8D|nr:hypothetical protein [Streptomyces sp. HNM0645]MDI9887205.1 hypothetical protein [Streptomyces sp. HNM0645]